MQKQLIVRGTPHTVAIELIPTSRDNTCCNWDPGFDFDFESTFAQVSQMTDWTTGFETAEANTDGRHPLKMALARVAE